MRPASSLTRRASISISVSASSAQAILARRRMREQRDAAFGASRLIDAAQVDAVFLDRFQLRRRCKFIGADGGEPPPLEIERNLSPLHLVPPSMLGGD